MNIVDVRAEFWTREIPNTKQENYLLQHEVCCVSYIFLSFWQHNLWY
jgi:hypothetical protein